jgi:hypothetical protein
VSESVFADDDVGREADGGGVPVVEGIDVIHVVFVGTDGAGEMIVFADADGIVRRGTLSGRNFPPDTGDVVGFVGLAAANLARALDSVQIVVMDAVPGEAWPLTTIDDGRCWGRIAGPRTNLGAFVVVGAVELNFVNGAVLLVVKKRGGIGTARTFHTLEPEDDPLTGGKLGRGSGLPAFGGANGFAGSLQFKKSGTGTRTRAERRSENGTEKEMNSGVRDSDASGDGDRVKPLQNHVGPTIRIRENRKRRIKPSGAKVARTGDRATKSPRGQGSLGDVLDGEGR